MLISKFDELFSKVQLYNYENARLVGEVVEGTKDIDSLKMVYPSKGDIPLSVFNSKNYEELLEIFSQTDVELVKYSTKDHIEFFTKLLVLSGGTIRHEDGREFECVIRHYSSEDFTGLSGSLREKPSL